MRLTVTKERVIEAANQCSDAKRILSTLFPEAFEGKPFNSTNENMEVRLNSYAVKDAFGSCICHIEDGMLYLEVAVNHLGIKTDSMGRILIHPDSK